MHPRHSHRIVEKTAENRFLQHQAAEADEAASHHAAAEDAPPALHVPPPADGPADTPQRDPPSA